MIPTRKMMERIQELPRAKEMMPKRIPRLTAIAVMLLMKALISCA